MIGKGSLVKLVHMEQEYGTGFNKAWLNDLVGTVLRYSKVVNVNDGRVSEICTVKPIVPVLSVKGNPVGWLTGINVKNLEEIDRTPVKTGGRR